MGTSNENIVPKESLTTLGKSFPLLPMVLLYIVWVTNNRTTDTGMGALKLDDEDDITHQRTPPNPPKLSPVSHLLHAMSSWCAPDTWQLLTRIRQDSGAQGVGTKVDSKGSFTGDSQCTMESHHFCSSSHVNLHFT